MEEWLLSLDRDSGWFLFYLGGLIGTAFTLLLGSIFFGAGFLSGDPDSKPEVEVLLETLFVIVMWPVMCLVVFSAELSTSERFLFFFIQSAP